MASSASAPRSQRGIVPRHAPVGRDAAVGGGELRVGGEGTLEQLLRFAELPAVGAQLAEQREASGLLRREREGCLDSSPRACGELALHALRRGQAQVRRGTVPGCAARALRKLRPPPRSGASRAARSRDLQ